jgi:zinc transport system substrate-binding protein
MFASRGRAGRRLPTFLLVLVLAAGSPALALTGCGSGPAAGGGLKVVTSFYPLQYVAERILGDAGTVTSLTKPGAEPHDLELASKDVARLVDADLVFYVKGFQPSVDTAVSQEKPRHVLDASRQAQLTLTYTPIEGGQAVSGESGSVDPHFWLDPVRLSAVSEALATEVARIDPAHSAQYSANAAALRTDLSSLDADYRAGLATCASHTLVTSHNAFGYLAARYGLTQEGITGISPDAEPTPSQLAAVSRYVREHKVTTIFSETLVSPRIADTVARETGARTAVLDPIEGLTSNSAGSNYLEVMRSNLVALRAGLQCS